MTRQDSSVGSSWVACGLFGLPLSIKLFLSLFLGVLGLSYLALLGVIWVDTEMSLPLIIEGYSDFETTELLDHSFRYFSWFIGEFAIVIGIFLFTKYSEKMKCFFAIAIPLFITLDIGAAWFIRFNSIFALQLYVSGFALAMSFLALFMLIQKEIWVRRRS